MTRATSNVLLDSTFVCTMDLPLPAFRFSHSFSFCFFLVPFSFFCSPFLPSVSPFCYFKDPSKSIWVKRSPCTIICCSLFVCFGSSRSEAQSVHFWHERFLQYIRIYIDTPAHKHMPHFGPVRVCVCVCEFWVIARDLFVCECAWYGQLTNASNFSLVFARDQSVTINSASAVSELIRGLSDLSIHCTDLH